MKKLNIFYYATIWSFIIGICCATYLNLINFIINFVWHVLFDKLPVPSQALPFFICIPFGFIIGILIKRLGSYPLTIEEVLMSVKQDVVIIEPKPDKIEYESDYCNPNASS